MKPFSIKEKVARFHKQLRSCPFDAGNNAVKVQALKNEIISYWNKLLLFMNADLTKSADGKNFTNELRGDVSNLKLVY